MDSQPKTVALPIDLGNRVLQYLGTRPYVEVRDLIDGLQQLEPQPDPEPSIEPE